MRNTVIAVVALCATLFAAGLMLSRDLRKSCCADCGCKTGCCP